MTPLRVRNVSKIASRYVKITSAMFQTIACLSFPASSLIAAREREAEFIGLASRWYSLLAIIPASCCCAKGSGRGVSYGSRFCTSHRKGRNPKAGKIDYETISSYMEDRIHDPPALGSPQEAPFHAPRLQTPQVFTSIHRQQSSPCVSRTGERTRLPHGTYHPVPVER